MPIQQRTDARRLAGEVPPMAIACVRPYGAFSAAAQCPHNLVIGRNSHVPPHFICLAQPRQACLARPRHAKPCLPYLANPPKKGSHPLAWSVRLIKMRWRGASGRVIRRSSTDAQDDLAERSTLRRAMTTREPASEVPVRVRVSNKWVPARLHSAGRSGAKAIAACAFVALIVGAGSVSNAWLPEKWSATDLRVALDPLTAQDTKSNPDISLDVAEGGHPMAQWKLGRM